ncbi:MAG: cation efflux system protein [Mycobacterium sp.]|nr:cation efflux system protein [Mycobacterium sp.]
MGATPHVEAAGPPEGHHGGHAHDHDHDHAHDHDHQHGHGLLARLRHLVVPHSHDLADQIDDALEADSRGTRALGVSLVGLGLTAAIQAVVVVVSGSVALLGDTLHNVADAATAIPLFAAFVLARRPPNRRYTYGYGRAEDLAGVAVVLAITLSAGAAAYEAVRRLLSPQPVHHLWAVALAGVIGFIGNELVARYRITVGRQIGSAALVADGLHARTDGFTSLAVVVGAGGVALGFDRADPIVGLLITLAILGVLRQAAREVYRRLMDAVDPELVATAERTLAEVPGVREVGELRLRWLGHQLLAEVAVHVDGRQTVAEGHAVTVAAEHALLHALPRLSGALVHADPADSHPTDHATVAHHKGPAAGRPADPAGGTP